MNLKNLATNVKLSSISNHDIEDETLKLQKQMELYFQNVIKYFPCDTKITFSKSKFENELKNLLEYAKGNMDFPDSERVCQDLIHIFWNNPIELEPQVHWQKWEKAGVTGKIIRGALIRRKYNSGELITGPELVYITEMSLEWINKQVRLEEGGIKGAQVNRTWYYTKKDVEESLGRTF